MWPNFVFQADYDEIKLQKSIVTSWPLRHRKTSQKNATKFFHFSPPPIKISGYASEEHYHTI